MAEVNNVVDREWCGYRFEAPWPPKAGFPLDFYSVLKWLDAKLSKGKLVWLRDLDGVATLTVAHKDANGVVYAARYWPGHRLYSLLENGTVWAYYTRPGNLDTSVAARNDYVVHWLPVDRAESIMMYMKNYDVYNAKGFELKSTQF